MGQVKEKWKEVVNFEGLYEISSFGSLKRLGGFTISNRKGYKETKILRPEKIIKPRTNINGYLTTDLYCYVDGRYKRKNCLVHRLVAEAFIGPQQRNKTMVMFINNDKTNLYYENLKWVNNSEAQINARRTGARGDNPKGWDYFESIPINQLNKVTDEVIKTFGSYGQATEITGIPHQNIRKVIQGERMSAGGFKWELHEQ